VNPMRDLDKELEADESISRAVEVFAIVGFIIALGILIWTA